MLYLNKNSANYEITCHNTLVTTTVKIIGLFCFEISAQNLKMSPLPFILMCYVQINFF